MQANTHTNDCSFGAHLIEDIVGLSFEMRNAATFFSAQLNTYTSFVQLKSVCLFIMH